MKKFASALAVAAAIGAPAVASAEINPYVRIDAAVGWVDSELTGLENDYGFQLGNISTSVVGLRGSQDIGNGLKVIGHFEAEIDQGGELPADFGRYAYVGVAGNFGSVAVGGNLNPLMAFWGGSTWAMGGNTSSSNSAVFGGYGQFWIDRSITYTAPKMGGLTAQAMYAFEDETGTASGGITFESLMSGFAKYDFGAFDLGAAVQQIDGEDVGSFDQTTWMVGGGTEIAGFKLRAGYVDNDRDNVGDLQAWHVGVAYNITPQLSAGVDYLQDNESRSIANAQVRYAMAKNLTFYGMVNRVDNEADDPVPFGGYRVLYGESGKPANDAETGFAVGMMVSF